MDCVAVSDCGRGETCLRRKPIVGTITGVFDGALDGTKAQLIRMTELGYTVKLLEAKGTFKHGDTLLLSPAEFTIAKKEATEDA
jgi:hypothetical protein